MRLLPLMLLVVCCSASAEWTRVSSSRTDESDAAIFYVDKDKIQRQGNIRRFWLLCNYNFTADVNGAMSWRSFDELDCKKEISKTVSISLHTEIWAGGKTIRIENPKELWDQIAPGTVMDDIREFVCSK